MSNALIELVGPCGRVPTPVADVPAKLAQKWSFATKADAAAYEKAIAPPPPADARNMPTEPPRRDDSGS